MRQLDNDIREICAKHRTGLTYLSFAPLENEHLNSLPALRIYEAQLQKSTSKTFTVTFDVFYNYPQGTSTFEDAREASKDFADDLSKMMEELIRTGLAQYKGYQVTGSIVETVFNGQAVTEHRVIALRVQATLTTPYKYQCCNEGTYFDFGNYLTTNTWSNR